MLPCPGDATNHAGPLMGENKKNQNSQNHVISLHIPLMSTVTGQISAPEVVPQKSIGQQVRNVTCCGFGPENQGGLGRLGRGCAGMLAFVDSVESTPCALCLQRALSFMFMRAAGE